MPDITMCETQGCPLAVDCYRSKESGTKPNGDMQSWAFFVYEITDTGPDCEWFLPLRKTKKPRLVTGAVDK